MYIGGRHPAVFLQVLQSLTEYHLRVLDLGLFAAITWAAVVTPFLKKKKKKKKRQDRPGSEKLFEDSE